MDRLSMDRLEERMRRMAAQIHARASSPGRRGVRTINVARRANVVTATNVGEPGAVQGASAQQHAPIVQEDGAADADTRER